MRFDATAEFDELERLDLGMRLRALETQEKDMLALREIRVAKYPFPSLSFSSFVSFI